jgi:hypothetical protein
MVNAEIIGSPNGSIHRTFRAVFEMPVTKSNHNLIKIRKRQYRNPIYLAREWRRALDDGEYTSPAALAHQVVDSSRGHNLTGMENSVDYE